MSIIVCRGISSVLDILIVGAGPAGLSLAKLLSGQGRTIGILDRQSFATLENPADDGREIALNQHSVSLLNQMGLFDCLEQDECSLLNSAVVLNGKSQYHLNFAPPKSSSNESLGLMASNHAIRRGLFQLVKDLPDVKLMTDNSILKINQHSSHIQLLTTTHTKINTHLLVAADSRFSSTRSQMGIGAEITDFGRSMLVCRMAHTLPHHNKAYEIFNYGQTLALLPLANNCSSVVITLPTPEIERLLTLDKDSFTEEVRMRLNNRLGEMSLISRRFNYPLVACYAKRFTANMFALVGDAAVGMHPVTAHGFNLGLLGAETLTNQLRKITGNSNQPALAMYEKMHKRATLPIFLGTNAIAKLYADDRTPARLIRGAGLRLANTLTPLNSNIVNRLMQV